MLLFLLACAIESDLKATTPDPAPFDDGEPADTAPPTDTAADDPDTAGPDETGDPQTDETGAQDTGTPDTGTPDTGTPDTGTPDTGTPEEEEPPTSTADPCPDAPDIDCPADVLDATPCRGSVAAWLPSGAAYTDVQDAIDDASPGDTVAVCAGTWSGNLEVNTSGLVLRGYGASSTVLDAGGLGTTITVNASDLVVADLTVTGGRTAGYGGGIAASATDLRLCALAVTGNEAYAGGGVYVAKGTIEIEGGELTGNTASAADGGAVYAGDTLLTAVGTTFSSNASGYSGGAVFAATEGGLALYDALLTGNTTGYEGGAVAVNGWAVGDGACFVDTTFRDNYADYAGGAVSSNGWGSMTFGYEGCTFDANSSGFGGGAVAYQQWGSDLSTTVDSTFTGNSAGNHGGAVDMSGGWGVIEASFYQTTFDGNFAPLAGAVQAGGVGTETVRLVDGAMTSNVATWAGGIYIDASSTVEATNVDFGSGATDNAPDDVYGYAVWGAGATFTCSGSTCR